MSHNVLDIRRFGGCDKGMRSVPATAKMWWSKTPQSDENPIAVLRNPNRRRQLVDAGGVHIQSCYVKLGHFYCFLLSGNL